MLSGFYKLRVALAMALQGKVDECVTFWAICCSSWVHMNSGTSKRDFLTPMGCQAFKSVLVANLLVARRAPHTPYHPKKVTGVRSFHVEILGLTQP